MGGGSTRKLYLGDNLAVLRSLEDSSVDLVYMDPPFYSGRDYYVVRHGEGRGELVFRDRFSWEEEHDLSLSEVKQRNSLLYEYVSFVARSYSPGFASYLVSLSVRLLELHRVLKDTGSLYLHCDPTSSHYLKNALDVIFGQSNFRNEIVWKRMSSHSSAKRWAPVHDVILFYSKSSRYVWNVAYEQYDESYIREYYRHRDERGRFALVVLTGAGPTNGDSGKPWRGIDPTSVGRHWAVPGKDKLPSWVRPPDNWDNLSAQDKLDFLDSVGLIYWPPKGSSPRFKRYLDTARGVPVRDVIMDIPPLMHRGGQRTGFPTQKPVSLLERIIQVSSNPGDTVLDPYVGSGTTLIAAESLGRGWIGIDSSPVAISFTTSRLRDLGVHGFSFIECGDKPDRGTCGDDVET